MTEQSEKPKTVTVRYIDEGEEGQEEAALRGIISGFAYLKTKKGQAELKAHREREKKEREAKAKLQSETDDSMDGDKQK
jgi:hypothetical protein